MKNKVLVRNEVNVSDTWDLTRLFSTEEDYENAITKLGKLVYDFANKYTDQLINAQILNQAINDYRNVITLFSYVANYQSLFLSSDQTNEQNVIRAGKFSLISNELNSKLVFFQSQLEELPLEILEAAQKESQENYLYLKKVIKNLPRKLSPDVNKALALLSPTLNAAYTNYNTFKLADMKFSDFRAKNKKHQNSFSLFENNYQFEADSAIRREAFKAFYEELAKYQNGFAANYNAHIQKENALASLSGFSNVFEHLLDKQDVSFELYNRQIDLLMEHLSGPMQKYAKLIKKLHNLDDMTYADLQISIDPKFEPKISIKQAKKYCLDGLQKLGQEYTGIIKKAYDERWIDFPQSIGKSTGGFCASPYQKGSYILLNWSGQMNEVFVLAHELGHAGHFYYASKHQNILNLQPSMYFIEAPSTMNEIILADYLKLQADNPRLKRWVLSQLISRTFYHNCVTHLLEAHFQRSVYQLVVDKKPITAKVLSDLKLASIRSFWGNTVKVDDYAGLTWMRQPHYFMGLYPYTYSAGLTVAVASFEKIKNNEISIDAWLEVLKTGGAKSPLELAKIAAVDLSTTKPVMAMINYIDGLIDEIIELTDQIENNK